MYYYTTDDCIACRRCAELCPVDAPAFDGDKFPIDPVKCVGCSTCAEACPGSAIFPEVYLAPPPLARRQEPESVPATWS